MNVRGKAWSLAEPRIMGVLNSTPDSFYASSRVTEAQVVARAGEMLAAGAAILDIGGQSTRPGAAPVGEAEEARRVLPLVDRVLESYPDAVLSVDTFYSSVAKAAVAHGCAMVNDISAGRMDPAMLSTVGALGVPYIAMHMQGTPLTMQQNPVYTDVALDILDFFIGKIAACREAGITDVIADPGFCFGKTLADNYTLLSRLEDFQVLDVPLAIGVSRKSMIWRLLEITPEEALEGTTALHMLALTKGVQLLRVHDVRPAVETVKLWEYYRKQG